MSFQGQGEATEQKERGLGAAFAVNLQIFKSRCGERYKYWHFDLNCGSGYNEKAKCIGSPVAFVRAANAVGVGNFFAGFCDEKSEFLSQLASNDEVKTTTTATRFTVTAHI